MALEGLAKEDRAILDQAITLLDQEEEEDNQTRTSLAGQWTRYVTQCHEDRYQNRATDQISLLPLPELHRTLSRRTYAKRLPSSE